MGELFQGLDRWNHVSVLDTRDVGAHKAGAFLDVALGEFLLFAECASPVAPIR
jgi:hypothetical protein